MPESPETLEPRPELSQVVHQFRRQRVEHGLAPRPETHRESGKRRAVHSGTLLQNRGMRETVDAAPPRSLVNLESSKSLE